jgi:hypothetical protein
LGCEGKANGESRKPAYKGVQELIGRGRSLPLKMHRLHTISTVQLRGCRPDNAQHDLGGRAHYCLGVTILPRGSEMPAGLCLPSPTSGQCQKHLEHMHFGESARGKRLSF